MTNEPSADPRTARDRTAESHGIVVTAASRAFGDVHAVRSATFTAEPGAVTALIGPNGSGKTTLLLMLATLLRPDGGSIRVGGFDPTTHPEEVRARMGWMPDILGSWSTLSVRATLEITGRLYRLSRAAAAARASELITLVGLDELATQPTRVLSRGQKQRLSLARSLVHDPSVLLLDEPASGLDPAARVDLRVLVSRLAGEGKTILISSHVLSELDEMTTAAVYIEAGVTASADRIAATRTSLRQWRIRSVEPGALHAALRSAGVAPERVSVDSLGTLVSVSGEADAAALLSALVASGAAISSFAPAVGDLEHTFLDLRRTEQS